MLLHEQLPRISLIWSNCIVNLGGHSMHEARLIYWWKTLSNRWFASLREPFPIGCYHREKGWDHLPIYHYVMYLLPICTSFNCTLTLGYFLSQNIQIYNKFRLFYLVLVWYFEFIRACNSLYYVLNKIWMPYLLILFTKLCK